MPVEVECEFCGDAVSRPPSVIERADHHFCNKACYGKWRSEHKDSRIVLQCDYCGTEYKRYEGKLKDDQRHTFCVLADPYADGFPKAQRRPETHLL
jgi:5-methylcytosine-specific restriction endonuclease McrA